MITEKSFDKQIKERGMAYYKEGKIKKVLKFNEQIYAKINGYITCLDNKNMSSCTCPCDFYCKHLYALFLYHKKGDMSVIPDLYDILVKKTKDELLDIIKIIVDGNECMLFDLNRYGGSGRLMNV